MTKRQRKINGLGGNRYPKPSTRTLGSRQPKNLPKQLETAVSAYMPTVK